MRLSLSLALGYFKGVGVTVRCSRRSNCSRWAFSELEGLLEYKTELGGVRVVVVDPKNTSGMCPSCHYVDDGNRSTRSVLGRLFCGYTAPADYAGALSVAVKAVVSQLVAAPPCVGAASSHP